MSEVIGSHSTPQLGHKYLLEIHMFTTSYANSRLRVQVFRWRKGTANVVSGIDNLLDAYCVSRHFGDAIINV